MKLNSLTQAILTLLLAILGYYYVSAMVQPTIDLYTIPYTSATSCSTDTDCDCIHKCLDTKE